MDDSGVTCDEIIESYDEDAEVKSYGETNFNENKAICKKQTFYILIAFFKIYYSIIDSY